MFGLEHSPYCTTHHNDYISADADAHCFKYDYSCVVRSDSFGQNHFKILRVRHDLPQINGQNLFPKGEKSDRDIFDESDWKCVCNKP